VRGKSHPAERGLCEFAVEFPSADLLFSQVVAERGGI
jgi:hypothetical protein